MATVCAMVVTYNRMELLHDCLTALVRQTRPCDRIVVIDNASTDGTPDMLASRWAGRVEVHSLSVNLGAAGGFNAGMRIAYRGGADAIWVMDDDVIPEDDALERLLAADQLLKARSIRAPFVISTAWSPKGHVTNVPDVDSGKNPLSYAKWPALLEHRMVPVRRATFVSILLPRETLARHGLPIASMFIWGEDTEYTLRVTREEPGYMVGDSRVVHVRAMDGNPDVRVERSPTRIDYYRHLTRNRVYTTRKYAPRRTLARFLWSQAKVLTELCAKREFGKANVVLRGLFAGLTFDPAIESADSPFERTGVQCIPRQLSPHESGSTSLGAE